VCLGLDMLVCVFWSDQYKTHRWRSSNAYLDQRVAAGYTTILDRGYSQTLRGKGVDLVVS
jgi:hypothetical protein